MSDIKDVMLTKAQILGFDTLGYDMQRVIFNKAKMFGWRGQEPSVLGNYSADSVLDEAIDYLLQQKVTFKKDGLVKVGSEEMTERSST